MLIATRKGTVRLDFAADMLVYFLLRGKKPRPRSCDAFYKIAAKGSFSVVFNTEIVEERFRSCSQVDKTMGACLYFASYNCEN